MEELLRILDEARTAAGEHQDRIAEDHVLRLDEAPVSGLGIAYNTCTLTREVIAFYSEEWDKPRVVTPEESASLRKQNAERLVVITKMMFVSVLAGIEFAAKAAVERHNDRIPRAPGRLYLSGIIRSSAEAGLLDDDEKRRWEGIIRARNTLVHNNGVAEETAQWEYPRCSLVLENGQMMRSDLRLLPSLTLWAVDAFGSWSDRFLSVGR